MSTHRRLVEDGWRPCFLVEMGSNARCIPEQVSYFGSYAAHFDYMKDPLGTRANPFDYKRRPEVSEFGLWELTSGRPLKFNEPRKPAPPKRKRFLGIF